jgi:hypothetical protein
MRIVHFPKKLNEAGFDHIAIAVAVIVISALAGSYFLVKSHAATPNVITNQIADATGFCVSAPNTQPASGSKAVLEKCSGAPAQQWISSGDNTLKLSGYCLSLRGTSAQTHLRLDTCNGSAGQQWQVNEDGTIVNPDTKLCVTNDHGRDTNGNTIQADTCTGGSSQQWSVTQLAGSGTNTNNAAPACNSLVASQVSGTQAFTLTASASPGQGATTSGYLFSFGDGSPAQSTQLSSVQHTYAPGNYTATVSILFNEAGKIVTVTSPSCTAKFAVTTKPAPGPTGSLDSFFAPAFTGASFCHFTKQNYTTSNGALTIYYPAGSSAPSAGAPFGGAQDCIPSSTGPQATLALTYKVRFPVGFQFVKGGKLPGIYGGIEPFSGGSHNPNGWSMRLMWRTGGAGEIYSYTAHTTGYGDEYGKGSFYWQADGQWHTVTERVTVNTPGAANGSVTLAYDGRQAISQTGIDVTDTNTLATGLFFSTFYGGHDRTWAPTANESIDFSSFSVSK